MKINLSPAEPPLTQCLASLNETSNCYCTPRSVNPVLLVKPTDVISCLLPGPCPHTSQERKVYSSISPGSSPAVITAGKENGFYFISSDTSSEWCFCWLEWSAGENVQKPQKNCVCNLEPFYVSKKLTKQGFVLILKLRSWSSTVCASAVPKTLDTSLPIEPHLPINLFPYSLTIEKIHHINRWQ